MNVWAARKEWRDEQVQRVDGGRSELWLCQLVYCVTGICVVSC